MHGRIIYFWDGILPLKTGSDFHYLNFYWNQLNGLGYVSSIDKYNVYILSYYLLQTFTHNIAITQYLLLSFLIALSTIGMYFLLKHLSLLSNNRINDVFPFIGALFYIFNYYFIFTYIDFYINVYIYSMLPFDILMVSLMLEYINNTKKFIVYTVFFVFAIEITSYSFLLVPMIALFLFILIAFIIIFYRYIFRSKFNLLKTIENFIMFILIFITTNIWWISGYFINFKSEYASTKASNTGAIINLFTTNLYNPLRLLNVISIYPFVGSIKYSNGFLWNIYYSPKFILFPILAVFLFLIILVPIILIGNKKAIFDRSIKIKLYIFTFITLFFALQGMNPINRYLFYLIEDIFPQFLPYLYATRLPFMRVPILFFYTIIFYESIYELFHLNLNYKKRSSQFYKNLINKLNNRKFRTYFIIVLLILILVIYPFYIYIPSGTQVYDTGHGNIPETVEFPKYFYSLSNYINKNANNSDTLILPLTYSMLSMNFSEGNAFADDNYAGLLFGSPVIIGQNQTLFNCINNDIQTPGTNFSILLNNINVKYIVINTIFDKYVHGYPSGTNMSLLNKYMESQKGLQLTKNFGPLIVYKNIYYNGIISSSIPAPNNFNIYGKENYVSIINAFKNINITFNKNISNYHDMVYNYNNDLEIELKNNTSRIHNGYYFRNLNPLNINMSKYHYLIVKAKSTNGNLGNGTYFAIDTVTYLNNYTSTTSYIKPVGSSTYYKGNTSFNIYIYPLYNNVYNDIVGLYNLSNGANSNLNYVTFAIGFHQNSTFPAYLNVSSIGFSKFINANSVILDTKNIALDFHSNRSFNVPNIIYKEINPTLYKVNIKNATGSFAIMLKQNYNVNWDIQGLNNNTYNHYIADSYANGWTVNKTGNYTFYIVFSPQKVYNQVNDIAITSNIASLSMLISIFFYTRRRGKW